MEASKMLSCSVVAKSTVMRKSMSGKNIVCTAFAAAILSLTIFGCSASRQTSISVDEQYGHRFDGTAPDGRETHVIVAPESGEEFVVHPAVFDTVHVRPELMTAADTEGVNVELLIKGSFPDSCTRLHSIAQERSGNIINMSLDMRRPRGALCASVVRPYRFYVELDGTYSEGNYTIKLNDSVRTFTIRPPES